MFLTRSIYFSTTVFAKVKGLCPHCAGQVYLEQSAVVSFASYTFSKIIMSKGRIFNRAKEGVGIQAAAQ
jgi:hypothetical protein